MDDQHQELENRAFLKAQVATIMGALHEAVSPQAYQIFERVLLLGEDMQEVADDLGVKRGVVDKSLSRTKKKLEEMIHESGISKRVPCRKWKSLRQPTWKRLQRMNPLRNSENSTRNMKPSSRAQITKALSKRFEQTVRETEKLQEN